VGEIKYLFSLALLLDWCISILLVFNELTRLRAREDLVFLIDFTNRELWRVR
jgi:hypothetical protein